MPRSRSRSFLVGALLALPAVPLSAQAPAALTEDTTTVRSFDGRTMPATIIRIAVPERRARPGRTITVSALRLPSTAERPGRPIVFLMGGPGVPGHVMAPIPPYFTLFERLRALADVIILDQRGLGRSEPILDCPFSTPLPADFFATRDRMVSAIRSEVAACAAHWRGEGADPTAYNTVESADDIDDIRRALGAEQIDLLGFSYGTRLALAYVARHGAQVGRIVLQGVNGPGQVLRRPAPVARKLTQLGGYLEKDSTWQDASDLLAAAREARERLARMPVTVSITDRRTGQPVSLAVGRDGFDAIVGISLDNARLPALLVSVAAGDARVLTTFVENTWNGLVNGTAGLMARAVNCAADRPAARRAIIDEESVTAPFGRPVDNEFLSDEFCGAVGYAEPAVEFAGPLVSDVPALLLTGALDATTPADNAHEVSRGLANATLLSVEGGAHELLPLAAVQDAIVDFLQGAEVRRRRIAAEAPRLATVDAALQPPEERRQ